MNDPAIPGGTQSENHCDYCHAAFVRDKRDVRETLNRYGAAYLAAGRDARAVRALAEKDSDGDGFSNDVEFKGGTNPGDAYNDYRGNAVWAALQAVGVLETATSVDVLSADGDERTLTIDELRKACPQAPPVMGLSTGDLGACG